MPLHRGGRRGSFSLMLAVFYLAVRLHRGFAPVYPMAHQLREILGAGKVAGLSLAPVWEGE